MSDNLTKRLLLDIDYVIDPNTGHVILTKHFLTSRGFCCGNGCMNCPYEPKYIKGNKKLKNIFDN